MELAYLGELLGFLEKIFPPATISKGFQRGFLTAALVLAYIGLMQLILCPPGCWLYYRRMAGQRVAQSVELADVVASLEGKAQGLETRINLMLRELEIRSGNMPASVTIPPVASPSSVAAVPDPVSPPATPALPPLPPPPTAALPLPPLPPLPPRT